MYARNNIQQKHIQSTYLFSNKNNFVVSCIFYKFLLFFFIALVMGAKYFPATLIQYIYTGCIRGRYLIFFYIISFLMKYHYIIFVLHPVLFLFFFFFWNTRWKSFIILFCLFMKNIQPHLSPLPPLYIYRETHIYYFMRHMSFFFIFVSVYGIYMCFGST